MLKFLQSLFAPKPQNIASITKSLTKMKSRLEDHADHHAYSAAEKRAQAGRLHAEADDHGQEQVLAIGIAMKLGGLLN